MAAKFILPTLALVGTAFAQCSGPLTITTSADAQTIASCSTYNGSITIDPSATGTIALNGIQQIRGDFTCVNATNLNAITSDQLNTITGTFHLDGLIVLSTLQMSSLTGVNTINWINLPALQALNFDQGISRANNVYISNTQLASLNGIELTQVGSMDVNNNPYLDSINVNNLANVTTALTFAANGPSLDISFPNLVGAANLTFRNVTSIEMPSLANVPGAMGFYSDMFTNFSAPNLTTIGQSLAFVDCPMLAGFSFPSLTYIGGGFLLANNSDLKVVDGLPALRTIAGAIDFAGSFDRVVFGNLTDVRGGANVQSTTTNASLCTPFQAARSRSVIKGSLKCNTSVASPQNNGSSSGSGSGSQNSASGLSSVAAPLSAIIGLMAFMLFL